VDGNIESFDSRAFRANLLAQYPDAEDVVVVASAASVSLNVKIILRSAEDANTLQAH
jgi:hypothetical protein